MRPEVELLLCCANTSLDKARTEEVKGLLRTDLDWAYVLQTARRHGVLPLLYRSLRTISPNNVPQAILEQLQRHSLANAAHNLFLTHELLKILKLLEAHAIPTLPYKGPLLTASIYGNLVLRDFADLDILVHEQNYQKAQRLLSTNGYQPVNAFEQESTFLDGSGRVTVDLHKRMTSCEFPSPLQFEQIWERRQQTTILSTKVPTLCPEDTLLMLAIQLTKDAGTPYLQLARICDIAQHLRAYPDLELIKILRQSKALGGERMVLFSLCMAHHLFETSLLQEVIDRGRAQPVIDQLVELTCQQLFDDRNPSVTDRRSIDQFRWLVRERLLDKLYPYYLRYVLATFVPCTLDCQLLPLPQRLAFLYYGIRPIRLLYKYGSLFFARHLSKAVR